MWIPTQSVLLTEWKHERGEGYLAEAHTAAHFKRTFIYKGGCEFYQKVFSFSEQNKSIKESTVSSSPHCYTKNRALYSLTAENIKNYFLRNITDFKEKDFAFEIRNNIWQRSHGLIGHMKLGI